MVFVGKLIFWSSHHWFLQNSSPLALPAACLVFNFNVKSFLKCLITLALLKNEIQGEIKQLAFTGDFVRKERVELTTGIFLYIIFKFLFQNNFIQNSCKSSMHNSREHLDSPVF